MKEKIYRYFVDDGKLIQLSTSNFKKVEHTCGSTFYEIPAGELGLKSKKKIYTWHMNYITCKQNLFSFSSDPLYAQELFEQKLREKEINISSQSKIIDGIKITALD